MAGHDSSMGRRDEADINYWRQLFKNDSSRGVTSLSVLLRTETGREDEGSGVNICRGSAEPRPVGAPRAGA